MSLLDDLRKKLKPEDLQTVEDILGDDFEWDLVPRSRLNKVIKQRNDLKKQVLDGGTQPSKSSRKNNDDDDIDDPDLTGDKTFTAEEVQKLLQKEATKSSDAVKNVEIKFATLSKLREANALDPDLVFGLLDSSKLGLSDKGELTGLKEAGFEDIQKNKAFLFSTEEDVPGGTGKQGSGGKGGKGGDALDAAIANVFAGYNVGSTTKEGE